VWRWQQRFAEAGVEGLLHDKTRKPGKPPIAADKAAQVVALTCTEPPHQAIHWTGRAMATAMGLALCSVQRIWRAHQLQPRRLRPFKRLAIRPSRPSSVTLSTSISIRRRMPWCFRSTRKPDPGARPRPARAADHARALPDHDA
jgi:homeodomain-containing protein